MKHTSILSLIVGCLTLASSGTATAVAVPGLGTWQTTLQARDINDDGIADAFYDTSTNLTWLTDANAIKTSGYEGFASEPYPDLAPQPSGEVNWFVAPTWVNSLNVHGVTGWRLPSLINQNSCSILVPHAVCEPGVRSGSSELENLIKITLGNTGGLANTGPFQNLQADFYWTGTQMTAWADSGSLPYWVYNTGNGNHTVDHGQSFGVYAFAWALHDGDIGKAIPSAVPEPSTYALLISGLIVTYTTRRRTATKPS